ncbi:MAG: DUF3857 domain-containing protein, partial [Candidatus Eisenbacteria bacterium]
MTIHARRGETGSSASARRAVFSRAAILCAGVVPLFSILLPGAAPLAGVRPPDAGAERFSAEETNLFGPDAVPAALAEEDAVVLFAGDYLILHDDGRIDHGRHRVIRLNTDLAIDQFGDPRVPYDTLRQELVVHSCRTFTPDGRTVEPGEHAFNLVTADAVSHCPDALQWQELVISHLGVERGCVVELDVEVRDRVPHAPWLEGTIFFSDEYPVVRRVVSVKSPAGASLKAAVVNGEAEEQTSAAPAAAGEPPATIRIWSASDLPALRESDDGCGGRLGRMHLLFTTCPDWQTLCRRLLDDFSDARRVDAAMERWASDMLLDPETLTDEDRARAVVALTAEGTREAAHATFERYRPPQSSARTFQTRCGSAWDRGALASALLDRFGFRARIALVSASRQPAVDLPMLGQFDRLLLAPYTADPDPDDLFYLDPSAGTLLREPQAHGDRALMLLGGPGEESAGWCGQPETSARDGRAEVVVSLVQEEGRKFRGTVDLALAGILHPWEELSDLDAFVTAYASRLVPGAEVTSTRAVEIGAGSARVRFDFTVAALACDPDGRARLRLAGGPVDPLAVCAPSGLHRPARTTPIFLPGGMSEHATWRIYLREDRGLQYLPPPERIENGAGSYTLSAQQRALPEAPRADE